MVVIHRRNARSETSSNIRERREQSIVSPLFSLRRHRWKTVAVLALLMVWSRNDVFDWFIVETVGHSDSPGLGNIIVSTRSDVVAHDAASLDLSGLQDAENPMLPPPTGALTPPRPQILLLPGPHKTGTTTLQCQLNSWIVKTKHPAFVNWSWPVPDSREVEKLQELLNVQFPIYPGCKSLAPFWHRLEGTHAFKPKLFHNHTVESARNTTLEEADRAFLGLYAKAMGKAWQEQLSVVVATEEMASLNRCKDVKSQTSMLKKFFDLLPISSSTASELLSISPIPTLADNNHNTKASLEPQGKNVMSVVVNYRAPRVDHLISLWHEVSRPGGFFEGESLLTFLLKPDRLSLHYFVLDSMGLAHAFAQRGGITVYIIDVHGVVRHQKSEKNPMDLPTVIACQTMGVGTICPQQHRVRSNQEARSNQEKERDLGNAFLNKNSDSAPRDVDPDTLGQIDDILNQYDCQFQQEFLARPNVHFLYPDSIFQKCHDTPAPKKRRLFSEAVEEIVHLVCSKVTNQTIASKYKCNL